jgi:single-stranded-DNA-specific exonuclease
VAEPIKAYRAEPYSYADARALAEELELSEPVAITLVRRGYRTPGEARAFLEADESHDPFEFRSMAKVVERLRGAIEAGERITVHGDFDVDGVCATTILVSALRGLGTDCDWLIPDRIKDGYGLSTENIERLAERGTKLLVTVDCGITAVEEVARAKELGIDVIVTDHHQAEDELPDCPILHPEIDGYPFEDLCGTAVAWKLASALRAGAADRDLDLVALATVADVVPLIGENRSLVRRGLEQVRLMQRPGVKALVEASKCEPTRLDEGDLAFKLAPRINAAGRLYRADAGVELFLTEDSARAADIAVELSRANSERRATEREVDAAAESARRELPERLREMPALVVAGEGWHPGVIGIVASRLVERHHRPAIVISLDGEGGGRGSGRSIPGFDLLAGLEACAEYLIGFGGHRAAAGLELRAESFDAFREAFAAHAAASLGPEDLRRTERIDAMVGGADLGLDLAEELGRLAPFGMGNPGVRLLVPAARVRDVRPMGQEGKHARFSLHSGAHRALGVSFGRSQLGVDDDDPVDAAVRLELNHWNGSVEPRVVLRELYPHAVPAAPEPPAEADAGEGAAAWWERFEAELAADPTASSRHPGAGGGDGAERTVCSVSGSAAACLAELASSGATVIGFVADAPRRAHLAQGGARIAEYSELELAPELARGFDHVVLVDPPASAELDALAGLAAGEGGYLHPAWGELEQRFALRSLEAGLAQRSALIAMFRELRDAGEELQGEELRAALCGSGTHPRGPEAAARCFRVLAELGLVQGELDCGDGTVRVVSSEGTELERSAAFLAYSARYQEGRQYLEGRKQT